MVRGENMIIANNEKGFSLVELMMAMVLTVGLMGAVFALMNQNQAVFVAESGSTDMSQNIRTAVDVMTRDIQSAGMGLSRPKGCFAAIFYTNGTGDAPDTLLIINGDPFTPWADVQERDDVKNEFICSLPNEVDPGSGGFVYHDRNNAVQPIYRDFGEVADTYVCYDDTQVRLFQLSTDGTAAGTLKLVYNPASYKNIASTFGSTIDIGEPDYPNSRIAKLGGLIAYRVNTTTNELERSEDLSTWQAVARGIKDLQIDYRVISRNPDGTINEPTPNGAPTERKYIRSVLVKIAAESPDLRPSDKGYRFIVQKFETAPRNFNLINNTSLSSNVIE
jgi:hypothetical protein